MKHVALGAQTRRDTATARGGEVLVLEHGAPGRDGLSALRTYLLDRAARIGDLGQGEGSLFLGLSGGCRCQGRYLVPMLQALRLPFTLFVDPCHLEGSRRMTPAEIRQLVEEGAGLGALWGFRDDPQEMSTEEAAWHLELLAHRVVALHPGGRKWLESTWLLVPQAWGDDHLVTLARSVGFRGLVARGRPAREGFLPWITPPRPRPRFAFWERLLGRSPEEASSRGRYGG
jgi:hypothetical protein